MYEIFLRNFQFPFQKHFNSTVGEPKKEFSFLAFLRYNFKLDSNAPLLLIGW